MPVAIATCYDWRPRFATRLAFATAGFGISCWGPLVPYAKFRLGVNDATLGLLLLCLGTGSLIVMPLTGALSYRYGSKGVIITSGIGSAVLLPLLALLTRPSMLGAALFAFGACLGSLDVAMNLHAIEVERLSSKPLMSGFHALFSIGGFCGSSLMTVMLSREISPFHNAIIDAILIVAAATLMAPFLVQTSGGRGGPMFALPRGFVLVLAFLVFSAFLVEGALLDWSALLLITRKIIAPAQGGIGYMLFSIAMTVGRLTGDRIVSIKGDRWVLLWGGISALSGFLLLIGFHFAPLSLSGFLLIGLGAANIVPILFRQAGNQRQMPGGLAIAAVTTAGYAGVLVGPASVGFSAHLFGLPATFVFLALLLTSVPALSKIATKS